MHSLEADAGCVRQPLTSILRLEALLMLAGLVIAYFLIHASWVLFVVLFFVPDVAMLTYVSGTRTGARAYNVFHSLVGPIIIAGLSLYAHWLLAVAVVWAAHIAMDRALGFGLKYADSFRHTHLGVIGRRSGASR
jgi:hypothetical protein